jgi:outer membrane protein TolC
MVKDINLTYNDMQESKSIAAIQKENEGCQRKMANNILEKKKSTADILNFKINELRAKAAAIEAEKSYKTNSYALATNMGMTSAALAADITQKSVPAKSFENDQNRQLGLNYYLDMAIKNRPDLKALKEALSAAKYVLYSATGALTPIVNSAAGNSNSSVYASENINLGSNIAEIRSKDADYAVQQDRPAKKVDFGSLRSQRSIFKVNLAAYYEENSGIHNANGKTETRLGCKAV